MAQLTSQPISTLAIALLARSLVLVRTVSRVPGEEFGGPSGGKVTLRVPQSRDANVQTTAGNPITLSNVDEVPVEVALRHLYDGTLVTDEDLSLTIENFGRQILRPQVAAVAKGAEDELATVMNALAADGDIAWGGTASVDDTRGVILAAREKLTTNDIPAGDRWLAVAPDIATRCLHVPEFVKVDASGDRSALRDAVVGRVFGLTVVESNALEAGTAVAYHSTGFGFGNRPPTAAAGADSTTASEDGMTLRHVLAFDASRLATISVVSTFAGASAVPDNAAGDEFPRIVRIGTDS